MEVIDNKAIVLNTKRPHLITETIKKSQVLSEDGGVFKVMVHWGLHEAQTLAHLKVKDVPSPIERDYTWVGKHKPFTHQRTTSSFLTLHKKAFCFNEGQARPLLLYGPLTT